MVKEFWITNISTRDITIEDLGCTIRANTSLNLLRGNRYSIEELLKSKESGSLFKKSKYVIVKKPIVKTNVISVSSKPFIRKERSLLKIKEDCYEELKFDELVDPKFVEEKFAEEFAELAEQDRNPLLKG